MALIKFGGGITAMSGSIAGNVFARNRFGYYARARTKPVNPHSVRQEELRTIVSYLAEYWHENMTAVQRDAWNQYGTNVAMKNKLGETVYMTGFNHFIRVNTLQLTWTTDPLVAAPTTFSLAEKDPTLICSASDIADQTFTFTFSGTGWGNSDDLKKTMYLGQGSPQLASRMFFVGPNRQMVRIDVPVGSTGTAIKAATFPFALGQKVWFTARIVTYLGRLSEKWLTDPYTVPADV